MDTVRFVKSFSKGQITIPKDIREMLGIVNEFWLKLQVQNGKIIAEPVENKPKLTKEEYAKMLLNIKGDWFSQKEHNKIRKEIEKKLAKSSL